MTPLNNLLTEANEGHTRLLPKSNFDLKWNEGAYLAFIESKKILANATLLVHPDPSAQLNITCDASDFAVGGVLQQYIDNFWQPLSFFSKKLSPSETRYSAVDSELLAVYATIRHFRHNLEGRNFFVNTDHKPLTYIMISVTERRGGSKGGGGDPAPAPFAQPNSFWERSSLAHQIWWRPLYWFSASMP